jgi:hypothetical protein
MGYATAMPRRETKVRRIATGAALAGVGVLVMRALIPKLHVRLMAGCERMFEQMPETFPPKRMMRDIEDIRASSARTLELLEERTQAERERLGTPSSNERKRRSPRPVRAS